MKKPYLTQSKVGLVRIWYRPNILGFTMPFHLPIAQAFKTERAAKQFIREEKLWVPGYFNRLFHRHKWEFVSHNGLEGSAYQETWVCKCGMLKYIQGEEEQVVTYVNKPWQ